MSYWKDARIAEAYKESEKITAPHAKQLIRQSGILQASESPLVVLDNACGTGVVSSQLHEMLDDSLKERLELTCADVSESMVEAVRQRIEACGWKANARVLDAQKLDLPSDYYTHVFTSFAIMLIPDASAALNECFRVLKPGGTCSFTVWHKMGWLPEIRGAFNHIPDAPPLPPNDEDILLMVTRNPWHNPSYVMDQLTSHGFKDVKLEIYCNSSPRKNPEEFVDAFGGMLINIVMDVLWKGEEKDKEEFKSKIRPGALAHLKEKYGEEQFELPMDSVVVTAKK